MTALYRPRVALLVVCLAGIVVPGTAVSRAAHATSPPTRASLASACRPSIPAATSVKGGRLARTANVFGVKLFHRLFNAAPRNDMFMSPLSVSVALDMLYGGARGDTATAMARVLGLDGMSQQSVDRAAATLIHSLQVGEQGSLSDGRSRQQPTKLRLANSVWSQANQTFNPQFISDLQRYFGADAQSLDLNSPSAPATINRWVSCSTNGKIKQILNSTRSLVMLLVNAVYFEGGWTFFFEPRETATQTFTTGSSGTMRVRMMHQWHYFGYYRGRDFQALSMPYGQKQRFSMIVVLPDKGVSLAQFAPQLTPTNWGYWAKRMATSRYGEVAFPHIDFSYSANLKNPLSALGMGVAFGRRANFSGVCVALCQVTEVLHKTFLHVDEKGTTVAAVTVVGLGGGGGGRNPFHFVADHPFFVGIRDHSTGALLFLGAVNKP